MITGVQAQTISPEPGQAAHIRFRSFYRDPDPGRLPALLSEFDRISRGDWTAHPPIIGFLAGAATKNPSLSNLLPRDASDELRNDLALALSLAGQREHGLAFARQNGMSEKGIALVRSTPTLQTLTIRNPTELDYLWGAAFATGEARYVRPIVKRFIQLTSKPEIADAILITSQFMRSKQGDIGWLKERHSQVAFLDIALGSAILTALARNAAEHEFIRQAAAAELSSSPQAQRILITFLDRRS